MKFKRKKCRRSIKCSHCTPYRWMGNRKGRFKPKDEAKMREDLRSHA